MQRRFKVLALLQLIGKLAQGLGDDGIQNVVGAGDIQRRAQHAELKLIAGKGKGGGSVAVCGVLGKAGQHIHPYAHLALALFAVGAPCLQSVQKLCQLIAQKHRDDGRRGLVGAQAVVVARGGHGDAQKIGIFIHRFDDGA